MAATSLDVDFKEELSDIEQCAYVCSLLITSYYDLTYIQGFKILSEAEHTAALYSLLIFYSNANPLLHYRPATSGQDRPHDTL